MTIEEGFADIEDIISKLDSGEITLEDSFKEYEKGIRLVAECNKKLDKVEKDIIVLKDKQNEHEV